MALFTLKEINLDLRIFTWVHLSLRLERQVIVAYYSFRGVCGWYVWGVCFCALNTVSTHTHTHTHAQAHRPWQADDAAFLPARNGPAHSKQSSQEWACPHLLASAGRGCWKARLSTPAHAALPGWGFPTEGETSGSLWGCWDFWGFFSPKENGEPKLQSSEPGLFKEREFLLSLKDIIPVILPVSLFYLIYLVTSPLI